jgi:type II secretory pathway pseudopilin PulG
MCKSVHHKPVHQAWGDQPPSQRTCRQRAAAARRAGLSQVEFAVILSIIGLLIALTMPAIQAAREASRSTQCKNNLRQQALALSQHDTIFQRYPSGGWGGWWTPDPDRGSGSRQPGGWVYGALPYLEQNELRELGRGLPPAEKRAAVTTLLQTSLNVFNCPSRARGGLHVISYEPAKRPMGAEAVTHVARGDYAANAGDARCEVESYAGPYSLEYGDGGYQWPDVKDHTGVIYLRTELGGSAVRDGKSNTYLVGEKYIPVKQHFTGADHGDDWSLYTGYQDDVCRSAQFPPLNDYESDTSGEVANCRFGSIHPRHWNVAFCDGAVRSVSFAIDPTLHRRLAHRHDNQELDFSSLEE